MIAEKLVFILLQLSLLAIPGFGGPKICKLMLSLNVIKTPTDPNADVDVQASFHINRGSSYNTNPALAILSGSTNQESSKYRYLPQNKGDLAKCRQDGVDTGYSQNFWNYPDHRFENCAGDFLFASNGKDIDNDFDTDWQWMWNVGVNFKCDGKQVVKRDCPDGGAEINVTCINLYSIDQQFPEFYNTLQTSLKNKKYAYNTLYQGYQAMVQRLSQAGLDYQGQNATCINNWAKHESCAANFFKPIMAIIASYGRPEVMSQHEITNWIKRKEWGNEGKWIKQMANLMKLAFNVTLKEVDSRLFTREMIYSMLHSANPKAFPWDKSPLSYYTKQWYQYAKDGKDAELQKILNLDVDVRVREFCKNEKFRSLLCSFMAAKNKYERSLLYLPRNNRTGDISVSAHYASDGLYSTFNNDLKAYLQTTDIKESVNQLGEKLGGYFATLAKFDNEIAKADVAYINTAIGNNEKRLQTNKDSMEAIVTDIRGDVATCTMLNMIEIAVKLIVAVAVTVATAGAAAPAAGAVAASATASAASAATTATIGIKEAYDIAKETGTFLKEFKKNTDAEKDCMDSVLGVQGSIGGIFTKINENKRAIDDMHTIVKAVQAGTSFNSTQDEVQRFLESYKKYKPAVTKEDLTELNANYTQMLDSFDDIIKNGGFLCSLVKGSTTPSKIGQARGIWALINALLQEIVAQQFKMIESLVKVVRSKLDESAAKTLETGLDYYSFNFEILVRHQLYVRVATQQFCNTQQFMNNNAQSTICKYIRDRVFLDDGTRGKIEAEEKLLYGTLESLKNADGLVNRIDLPIIPLTTGNDTNLHAINWDKLMDGEVVEFALPVNDSNFVAKYGWNPFPKKDILLKSMEIFLPNNILKNDNKKRDVLFKITAIQDSVVINLLPNSTKYTIKSEHDLSTESEYSINVDLCDPQNTHLPNPFVTNGPKYCLPMRTGVFTNNLKLSPPVSLYSKFLIQLDTTNPTGYDSATRQLLKQLRPENDTLQLRARIKVYSSTSGGKRTNLPAKAKPPVTKPCGPKEYRKFIDSKTLKCEACPSGSIPIADGSYCVNEATVKMLAAKGVKI